ncbi:LOW QUALITY PROTEIN: hypothetical protein RJ639_031520 [Escallonia herrerae]|uniref:Uncharacterized protein n=1 Tax=Escallonia herrerae TaxID=1293975 RepID=A0AA89BHQ0_9ASTE|nr:LOW QUALITY PROTEIN: hypothetical protein RJ639_031520 [Escallonia herrerae]
MADRGEMLRNGFFATGMNLTNQPIGHVKAATAMQPPHCNQSKLTKLYHHHLKYDCYSHNPNKQMILVKTFEYILLLQLPCIKFVENLTEYKYVEDKSPSIPHSVAIAFAVNTLSPVIILMSTPAYLQTWMAFFAPGLHGSLRPTIPSNPILFKLLLGFSIFILLNFSFWNLLMSKCNATKATSGHSLDYHLKLHPFIFINGL